MPNLPDLRRQLADAKICLRDSERFAETAKVIAEQEAIEAAAGDYGKNEIDRRRFLVLALARSEEYAAALNAAHNDQAYLDRVTAEIAAAEDERAERRLAAQDRASAALVRYADALEHLSRVPPRVAAAATGIGEGWGQ